MTTEENPLTFLAWHKPSITPGEYTIQVHQTIVADNIPTDDPGFSTALLSFAVFGEHFVLPPAEVHSVFPPDGSMGDHWNVLPHVVLCRSTLPWERVTDTKDEQTPWLALLVFHDGEDVKTESICLRDAIPGVTPERGESLDDKVTVIDVEQSLLKLTMPNASELAQLAHVRKRGEVELAVVIGNRLPKPNGFSTAHLVCLEHRFTGGMFHYADGKNGRIRLISLASFRFGCVEPKQSFTELLRALNDPAKHPDDKGSKSLRLPESLIDQSAQKPVKDAACEYLASGSVPLRYRLRTGQTAASWYHGPLAPAQCSLPEVKQPHVKVSDELVRYSSRTGMFDVSYATAWEAGRLLALQDKKFSLELQDWKQEHAKKLATERDAHPLANPNKPVQGLPLPTTVKTWLDRLSLLECVPFSYLVPDERMLPLESIRFFWFDPLWIDCLLDGAFSIGRHTDSHTTRDAMHKTNSRISRPYPVVTGVIVRSEVVSGWPGLQLDGYNGDQVLKRLRLASLSPNVLLCLFEGEITDVIFHQKIETLHFGFELKNGKLVKKLRNEQEVKVLFKPPEDKWRVIDLDCFKSSSSADFAHQMIENVEEVKFSIKTPH